jgi:hypothetical protein
MTGSIAGVANAVIGVEQRMSASYRQNGQDRICLYRQLWEGFFLASTFEARRHVPHGPTRHPLRRPSEIARRDVRVADRGDVRVADRGE